MKSEAIQSDDAVDNTLILAGFKATGLKTPQELVDYALRELLRHEQQQKI